MKLKIATCQFPVAVDIKSNLRYVLDQLRKSVQQGARVVHFSEVALSGYAGVEFKSHAGYDWDLLKDATQQVIECARRLRVWVILGSTHRLTGKHRPHNSLYIIDPRGRIVDRYDKRFCTGRREVICEDLKHYSPGSHLPVFTIDGVGCGVQICHDLRYEELYRQYSKRRVQLVFHSYHNGHASRARYRKARRLLTAEQARLSGGETIHGMIVPATMQTYAANNYMWISANNTSAPESSWPSFVVRPDGVITGRLARNRAGVLVTTVDTSRHYYDASKEWRDRAIRGVLHSGRLVDDPRSRQRNRV